MVISTFRVLCWCFDKLSSLFKQLREWLGIERGKVAYLCRLTGAFVPLVLNLI
jgi:hypothetical protein